MRLSVADDPVPNWNSIAALPQIASLIDGQLTDGQEHYVTLLRFRDRPHVLDDATVERGIQLHTAQMEFIGVLEKQLSRWQSERLSPAQTSELDRLKGQLDRLRKLVSEILKLAQELKQGTIAKALAKKPFVRP